MHESADVDRDVPGFAGPGCSAARTLKSVTRTVEGIGDADPEHGGADAETESSQTKNAT